MEVRNEPCKYYLAVTTFIIGALAFQLLVVTDCRKVETSLQRPYGLPTRPQNKRAIYGRHLQNAPSAPKCQYASKMIKNVLENVKTKIVRNDRGMVETSPQLPKKFPERPQNTNRAIFVQHLHCWWQ